MPLKIIRQDITKIKCDAIVDPTDTYYSHGGGVDAMIHEAAGEELYRACLKQRDLLEGQAVVTPAFSLPCKYVIHTVGPVWEGGDYGEEAILRSCYSSCLELAVKNKCKSVAFPLIASGTFGFPKDRVLKIAVDVIGDFLFENEMLIYLVVFDKTAYSISERLFSDVSAFIDDAYSECRAPFYDSLRESYNFEEYSKSTRSKICRSESLSVSRALASECDFESAKSLDEMLKEMDKGFAETLFGYIDEKGISDVECYKRANVDKKTFSKIKCNKNYKPSKVTAISFAIALRLNLEQTNHLLNTVGMSLSRSNKFDVIIEYFIMTGNYKDIFDVNETLYQFDQVTLGV
ncbi:MAG: macro domain-containing protein [Clostridia bacterium]|nr:macro domain-containing protein [Clostridia bacterium]